MNMKGARVRGVYGKPWSKLAQEPIRITPEVLDRLGRAIVDAIVLEAKKDLAKEGRTPPGKPEGLPNTPRFFESFGYRISGGSTVEVTCSWPFIEQVTEGRKPFRMTWLTAARGGQVVPITTGPGVVIFRMVPPRLNDAWVHPGYAKHHFIRRGVEKGRAAMMEIITREAAATFLKGDPFR
jgi:hypothetical protein